MYQLIRQSFLHQFLYFSVRANVTDFAVLQMHRLVNSCLREELAGPVHALRIDAYATSQFSNEPPTAPPKCAHNHTE